MKPTQEQLDDPNWWDEHTPEGTTHLSTCPGASFPWLKDDGVNIFWSSGSNEWTKYTDREVREDTQGQPGACRRELTAQPAHPSSSAQEHAARPIR